MESLSSGETDSTSTSPSPAAEMATGGPSCVSKVLTLALPRSGDSTSKHRKPRASTSVSSIGSDQTASYFSHSDRSIKRDLDYSVDDSSSAPTPSELSSRASSVASSFAHSSSREFLDAGQPLMIPIPVSVSKSGPIGRWKRVFKYPTKALSTSSERKSYLKSEADASTISAADNLPPSLKRRQKKLTRYRQNILNGKNTAQKKTCGVISSSATDIQLSGADNVPSWDSISSSSALSESRSTFSLELGQNDSDYQYPVTSLAHFMVPKATSEISTVSDLGIYEFEHSRIHQLFSESPSIVDDCKKSTNSLVGVARIHDLEGCAPRKRFWKMSKFKSNHDIHSNVELNALQVLLSEVQAERDSYLSKYNDLLRKHNACVQYLPQNLAMSGGKPKVPPTSSFDSVLQGNCNCALFQTQIEELGEILEQKNRQLTIFQTNLEQTNDANKKLELERVNLFAEREKLYGELESIQQWQAWVKGELKASQTTRIELQRDLMKTREQLVLARAERDAQVELTESVRAELRSGCHPTAAHADLRWRAETAVLQLAELREPRVSNDSAALLSDETVSSDNVTDAVKNDCGKLRAVLVESEAKIAELESLLRNKTDKISACETELMDVRKESTVAQELVIEKDLRMDALINQINERNVVISTLNRELLKKDADLRNARAEKCQLDVKVSSVMSENLEVAQAASKVKEDLSKLTSSLYRMKKDLAHRDQTIENLRSSNGNGNSGNADQLAIRNKEDSTSLDGVDCSRNWSPSEFVGSDVSSLQPGGAAQGSGVDAMEKRSFLHVLQEFKVVSEDVGLNEGFVRASLDSLLNLARLFSVNQCQLTDTNALREKACEERDQYREKCLKLQDMLDKIPQRDTDLDYFHPSSSSALTSPRTEDGSHSSSAQTVFVDPCALSALNIEARGADNENILSTRNSSLLPDDSCEVTLRTNQASNKNILAESRTNEMKRTGSNLETVALDRNPADHVASEHREKCSGHQCGLAAGLNDVRQKLIVASETISVKESHIHSLKSQLQEQGTKLRNVMHDLATAQSLLQKQTKQVSSEEETFTYPYSLSSDVNLLLRMISSTDHESGKSVIGDANFKNASVSDIYRQFQSLKQAWMAIEHLAPQLVEASRKIEESSEFFPVSADVAETGAENAPEVSKFIVRLLSVLPKVMKTLHETRNQSRTLSEQVSDMKRALQSNAEGEALLSGRVVEMELQCSQLKQENADLLSQNDDLCNRVQSLHDLEAQNSALRQEVAELQSTSDGLLSRVQSLEAQNSLQQDKLVEQRRELKATRESVNKFENSEGDFHENMETPEVEFQGTNRRLSEVNGVTSSISGELECKAGRAGNDESITILNAVHRDSRLENVQNQGLYKTATDDLQLQHRSSLDLLMRENENLKLEVQEKNSVKQLNSRLKNRIRELESLTNTKKSENELQRNSSHALESDDVKLMKHLHSVGPNEVKISNTNYSLYDNIDELDPRLSRANLLYSPVDPLTCPSPPEGLMPRRADDAAGENKKKTHEVSQGLHTVLGLSAPPPRQLELTSNADGCVGPTPDHEDQNRAITTKVLDETKVFSFSEVQSMITNDVQETTAKNFQLVTEAQNMKKCISELELSKMQLSDQVERLKNMNSQLVDQVQNLESNKYQQVAQIERLEDDKNQLTDQVKQIEGNNCQLTDQVKQLEGNNCQLTDQVKQLDGSNCQLTDQVKQFELSNCQLTDQVKQLEGNNCQLTDQVKQLEGNNCQLTDQVKHLEGNNCRLTDQVKQLQCSNSQLTDQVKQLEGSNSQLTDQVKQRESSNSQLTDQVKQLEGNNCQLTDQVKQLEGNNCQLTDQVKHLEGNNCQLTDQVKQLEGNNYQLTDQVKQLEGNNYQLTDQVKQLEGNNCQLTDRVMQLEGNNCQLTDQVKHLEGNNCQLTDQVKQLEGSNYQLTDQVKQLEGNNCQLTDQVKQLESSKCKLTDQVKQLEGSNCYLTDQVKQLEGINCQLIDQVKQLDGSNCQLTDQVKHLQGNNCQLTDQVKQLEGNSRQLTDQVKQLEGSNYQLTDQVKQLEGNNCQLTDQVKQLEGSNCQLTDQVKQLEGNNCQLTDQVKQLEGSNCQLTDQVKQLENSNCQLTDQVKQLENSNCQLTDQVKQLENSNYQLTEQVNRLESSSCQLTDEVKQLEGHNCQLTDEVKQLEGNNCQLTDEVKQLEGNNCQLTDQMKQLEYNNCQLTDQVQELESKMSARAELPALLEGKIADLELQVEQLSGEENQLNKRIIEVSNEKLLLDEEVSVLQQKLLETNLQRDDALKESSAQASKLSTLKDENVNVSVQVQELRRENSQLREVIDLTNAKVNELNATRETNLRTGSVPLPSQGSLVEITKVVEAVKSQKNGLTAKIKQLQSANFELIKQLKKMEEKNSDEICSSKVSQDRKHSLEVKVHDQEKTIKDLSDQLNEALVRTREMGGRCDGLLEENGRLNNITVHLMTKICNPEKQVSEIDSLKATIMLDGQSGGVPVGLFERLEELLNFEQKCKSLEEECHDKENQKAVLSERIEDIQLKEVALTGRVEDLLDKEVNYLKQIEETRNKCSASCNIIEEHLNRQTELEKIVVELQNDKTNIACELTKHKSHEAELDKQVTDLLFKNEELSKKLGDCASSEAKLIEQLQQIEKSKNELSETLRQHKERETQLRHEMELIRESDTEQFRGRMQLPQFKGDPTNMIDRVHDDQLEKLDLVQSVHCEEPHISELATCAQETQREVARLSFETNTQSVTGNAELCKLRREFKEILEEDTLLETKVYKLEKLTKCLLCKEIELMRETEQQCQKIQLVKQVQNPNETLCERIDKITVVENHENELISTNKSLSSCVPPVDNTKVESLGFCSSVSHANHSKSCSSRESSLTESGEAEASTNNTVVLHQQTSSSPNSMTKTVGECWGKSLVSNSSTHASNLPSSELNHANHPSLSDGLNSDPPELTLSNSTSDLYQELNLLRAVNAQLRKKLEETKLQHTDAGTESCLNSSTPIPRSSDVALTKDTELPRAATSLPSTTMSSQQDPLILTDISDAVSSVGARGAEMEGLRVQLKSMERLKCEAEAKVEALQQQLLCSASRESAAEVLRLEDRIAAAACYPRLCSLAHAQNLEQVNELESSSPVDVVGSGGGRAGSHMDSYHGEQYHLTGSALLSLHPVAPQSDQLLLNDAPPAHDAPLSVSAKGKAGPADNSCIATSRGKNAGVLHPSTQSVSEDLLSRSIGGCSEKKSANYGHHTEHISEKSNEDRDVRTHAHDYEKEKVSSDISSDVNQRELCKSGRLRPGSGALSGVTASDVRSQSVGRPSKRAVGRRAGGRLTAEMLTSGCSERQTAQLRSALALSVELRSALTDALAHIKKSSSEAWRGAPAAPGTPSCPSPHAPPSSSPSSAARPGDQGLLAAHSGVPLVSCSPV